MTTSQSSDDKPDPLQPTASGSHKEQRAASMLQAAYRSHVERRTQNGLALHKDPDKAWFGVVDQLLGSRSAGASKWRRVTQDASIVGKGSTVGEGSLMLKREHWLEATDTQHRYGSNLAPYHAAWANSPSVQPFFHWLDAGDGADLELPEYLTAEEREAVAAEVDPAGLLRFVRSGELVHTLSEEDSAELAADPDAWRAAEAAAAAMARGGDEGVPEEEKQAAKKRRNSNKWIFVASADMSQFFIAPKKKGTFGHSSFLAGGAVGAAGQLTVDRGQVVKLAPMSGHYVPSIEHYIAFLDRITDAGVDLSQALLLNPFEGELPANCRHALQRAVLSALDDKERHGGGGSGGT